MGARRSCVAAVGTATWVLAAASCGGKAVVDRLGTQDGAGGDGGGGGGGPSGICATPEPYGGTIVCATGTTADGCYRELCDAASSSWRATCNAAGCACSYNDGEHACSCTGGSLDPFCTAGGPSCCPNPFP
jgi:hypothetical protein